MTTVISILSILHGLVHLLYAGHTRKYFELEAGLTWPDGSWAFSRLLGSQRTRLLAAMSCVIVAVGFSGLNHTP